MSDLERLRLATVVRTGPFGFAQVRSEDALAFRRALAGRPALADLERMITTGTPAGRIYGLLLLRAVEPDFAFAAVRRLAEDRSRVMYDPPRDCGHVPTTVGAVARWLLAQAGPGEPDGAPEPDGDWTRENLRSALESPGPDAREGQS